MVATSNVSVMDFAISSSANFRRAGLFNFSIRAIKGTLRARQGQHRLRRRFDEEDARVSKTRLPWTWPSRQSPLYRMREQSECRSTADPQRRRAARLSPEEGKVRYSQIGR